MDFAVEAAVIGRSRLLSAPKSPIFIKINPHRRISAGPQPKPSHFPLHVTKSSIGPFDFSCERNLDVFHGRIRPEGVGGGRPVDDSRFGVLRVLMRQRLVLGAMVIGVLGMGCRRVLAAEGVLDAGFGVFERSGVVFWPKMLLVLRVLGEEGLVLAALLGLSAFFSLAETSITTLWPWKMAEEGDSLEKFAKDLEDHVETEIIKYPRLETGQIERMEKTLRKEMRKAAKDLKDMAKDRVRLNEEAKRFFEGRKKLNACLQKMFEDVCGEILTLLWTKEQETANEMYPIFFPAESTQASQGVPILNPAEPTQGDMETSVPTQTAQDQDSGTGSRAKRKHRA